MKISIITVTFNAEKTIEDSLKTVLSQTYPNIEHIIIDGKSTDNTCEIIKKYQDKIAHFMSEKDTGIFNAMNKGIKLATGDILFFLNANDYLFDENVISDVISFFKKTGANMVFGNMSFVNDNGIEQERRIYSDVDKLFWINECVCHQGIFYKKKVFEICGEYNENYQLTSDYDMNLKVHIKHKMKVRYFNRVISRFTLGGQSNSHNNKQLQQKLIQEKNEILNTYFNSVDFKMNKILNKTFRSIARNQHARKVAGKIFGFNL